MILLSLLPFALFFLDASLISIRRRIDLVYATGLTTLIITLGYTIFSASLEIFSALGIFENAILVWATVQAFASLIYRRSVKDPTFLNTSILLDGIIIMLLLITLIDSGSSGQIDLGPLYLLIAFAGFSCTLIAGVHVLSDGNEHTGDILAKAAWVLIGAAMVIEIDALIRYSQEPLADIFQTTTFLPWIFITAYFHSGRMGKWAKRISGEMILLGLLITIFYTFSGNTLIPFYPSSNVVSILLLLSIPFAALLIRLGGTRQELRLETGLIFTWILLTGLGLYLLTTEIFISLGFLSNSYLRTTFFEMLIITGLLGSGAIFVNNAITTIKRKTFAMIIIAAIPTLPLYVGLIELDYLSLLMISIVSAAFISAVYSLARRRLRLLSIIGFTLLVALGFIHFRGYINIDSFELKLGSGPVKDTKEVMVEFSGYEFIGLRDVVKLPEREMEVPKQAILLIDLDISVYENERLIRMPIIYDVLEEVSGTSPIYSDTFSITHGLNDFHISVEPNEVMAGWLRSAYSKAILGERFDAPLNTVNILVKQVSFTAVLIIGLTGLIVIGIYQLPYSARSEIGT